MQKKYLLATALVLATASLTSCSTSNGASSFQITTSQIRQFEAVPKVTGYSIDGSLDFLATFSSRGQGWVRVLGTIEDVLPPVEAQNSLGDKVTWVPIIVNVEQSDPKTKASRVTLRLLATDPSAPNLADLYAGQRVLAIGNDLPQDSSKTASITLGWIFGVDETGSVLGLQPDDTHRGKFNTFASLLRMEPLG